jgi:RND superfamily putative drug exporter
MQLLTENFPDAAKGRALVVFEGENSATLASHHDAVETVLRDVSALEHVASVSDPFAAGTVSDDGRIGYAELELDVPEREMGKPAFTVLSDAVSGMSADGVRVELGGDAVFLNAEDNSSGHVAVGLLVALLVLLVVFGTLVAAVVPIGLSLIAVGTGIGAISVLAHTIDVSVSAVRSPVSSGWASASTMPCSSSPAIERIGRRAATIAARSATRWARPAPRSCSLAAQW